MTGNSAFRQFYLTSAIYNQNKTEITFRYHLLFSEFFCQILPSISFAQALLKKHSFLCCVVVGVYLRALFLRFSLKLFKYLLRLLPIHLNWITYVLHHLSITHDWIAATAAISQAAIFSAKSKHAKKIASMEYMNNKASFISFTIERISR